MKKFIAIILLASQVVHAGPLSRSLRPNMAPFIQTVQAPEAQDPQFVLLGETHGQQRYHNFYVDALTALHQADQNFDCLLVESPKEYQPVIEQFMRGEISAGDVNYLGVLELFKRWDLFQLSPNYDWKWVAQRISKDAILSPRLLQRAKKLGIKVIPLDHLELTDFVTMTYLEVQRTRGDEAAKKHVEDTHLLDYLAKIPSLYYKNEIINRRNGEMTAATLQSFKSGQCKRGLGIVGAMHAFKMVAMGAKVYSDGVREPMNTRLQKSGLPSLVLSMMISSSAFGFEGVPAGHPAGIFRIESRWSSSVSWRDNVDYDATVIIRE